MGDEELITVTVDIMDKRRVENKKEKADNSMTAAKKMLGSKVVTVLVRSIISRVILRKEC